MVVERLASHKYPVSSPEVRFFVGFPDRGSVRRQPERPSGRLQRTHEAVRRRHDPHPAIRLDRHHAGSRLPAGHTGHRWLGEVGARNERLPSSVGGRGVRQRRGRHAVDHGRKGAFRCGGGDRCRVVPCRDGTCGVRLGDPDRGAVFALQGGCDSCVLLLLRVRDAPAASPSPVDSHCWHRAASSASSVQHRSTIQYRRSPW